MSSPRLRRLLLAVSVTGIALTLTACVGVREVAGNPIAQTGSAGSASTSPTSTSTARTGSPAPNSPAPNSPAPSTKAPPAAPDGTDLTACADGECEVRVTAPAEIPVPPSTTVVAFRVESIGADEATFTGRNTGNRSGGSCTGRCRVSSTNGVFTMTLGVGGAGRQNGLAVTLMSVADNQAVVRLGVA